MTLAQKPFPVSGTCEAQVRGEREAVVAAARKWVGTPYHHMADIKGVGVDCAMILVRVYVDLGLVEAFDPRPYPHDWMLHRDDERYLGFLFDRARQADPSTGSGPRPGDVMMFKVGRCFAHGAIITTTDPLRIVHAYASAGMAIEEEPMRNSELSRRQHKFFSLWSEA
ncbi:MAG: hypothetical protein WAN43_16125 [Rhodomicrobium sp.]